MIILPSTESKVNMLRINIKIYIFAIFTSLSKTSERFTVSGVLKLTKAYQILLKSINVLYSLKNVSSFSEVASESVQIQNYYRYNFQIKCSVERCKI